MSKLTTEQVVQAAKMLVEHWENAPERAEALRKYGLTDEGVAFTLKAMRDMVGGEELYRELKSFLETINKESNMTM